MADLRGARVGLLESRMGSELAGLVRRHGGEPRLAPALREVPLDATEEVVGLLDALQEGTVAIVLFLTGVGTAALFREAERLGRLDELVAGLRRTHNLCRGQKPWLPLKRQGVPITATVEEPYTTYDVLSALRSLAPAGKSVALLHYGERSAVLAGSLVGWGASVLELCLYEWRLPEDTEPMEQLIEEVVAGELEAVAFTSQVQVRHLFAVADRLGRRESLVRALNGNTLVAAVGPTCAMALGAVRVAARVVPAHPKMGPMVLAIADHLAGSERLRGPLYAAVAHV